MDRLSGGTLLLMTLLVGCAARQRQQQQGGGPSNFGRVDAMLYRGGQPSGEMIRLLRQEHGVTRVINLNAGTADSEAAIVESLGLQYVSVPMRADHVTLDDLKRATDAIDGATGPVYVHCKHGMDRTGIVVAAWRVRRYGWTAARAMRELRRHQAPLHGLLFGNLPDALFAFETALPRG